MIQALADLLIAFTALGALLWLEGVLNKASLGASALNVQDTDLRKLGGHSEGFRAVLGEQRVAASRPRVDPGQGQAQSGAACDSPHLPSPPCLVGHTAWTFTDKARFFMFLPSLCSSGCIFSATLSRA